MITTLDLTDLFSSPYWIPMESKLNEMLNQRKIRLEFCKPDELLPIQAEIKIIRLLLGLPEMQKENI